MSARYDAVIVGGGHIGRAVADLAADLDFEVWVTDDRARYVGEDRFPRVDRRLAGPCREILPALEHFPSDDPAADALRVNRLLEERIRRAPEQYYWVHRRFKERPPEFPDPYT